MPNRMKCSVPGCSSRYVGASFHRFPMDKARCSIWVQRVKPSLSANTIEQLHTLRVCGIHFTDNQYMNPLRMRLVHNAVPSLHLPTNRPINVSSVSGEDHTVNTSASPTNINVSSVSGEDHTENTPASSINIVSSISGEDHIVNTSASSRNINVSSVSGEDHTVNTPPASPTNIAVPSLQVYSSPSIINVSGEASSATYLKSSVSGSLMSRVKKKSRRCLLQQLELSQHEITPKKDRMLKFTRRTLRNYTRLRNRAHKMRGKMNAIVKLATCTNMDFFLQHDISPAAAAIACGDARNRVLPPNNRRWTRQEKLLALALYKRSPKAYRFLSGVIVLPSRTTLMNLLKSVVFNVGINHNIIQHLGERVKKMNKKNDCIGNEFCALYFDEMSFRCGIYYNESVDRVDGFEDFGSFGRSKRKADHALVFMVRGLRGAWKQPVAYYLSHSTTPTEMLQQFIVDVIRSLSSAGIYVKATVCDQGPTNRSAVKNLVKIYPSDTKENFVFQIDSEKIVTIWDVPHLLKCTRNNLMQHDLITDEGTAKWEYVQRLLIGNKECLYSMVHKITDSHVTPKGKDKMRVYLAAQIFSRSCHSAMKVLMNGFPHMMPVEAKATSELLLFMNNLFDSLNGSSRFAPAHSPLQCRLSETSDHTEFWNDALIKLNNFKFFNCIKGKVTRPPSQDGWITTIRAVQHLWKELHCKKYSYLMLRCLNQDGLEIFFSVIRQHGGDNNNPISGHFQAAFKTSLINGLCSSSRNKNCEDDDGQLLCHLDHFLKDGTVKRNSNVTSNVSEGDTMDEESDAAEMGITSGCSDLTFSESQSVAYISGFIAKRLMQGVCRECDVCKFNLTSQTGGVNVDHEYLNCVNDICSLIAARDCRNKLEWPSIKLYHDVAVAANVAKEMLPNIIHTDAVGCQLSEEIARRIEYSWAECSHHKEKLIAVFSCLFNRITIHRFCNLSNAAAREAARRQASQRKNRMFQHN